MNRLAPSSPSATFLPSAEPDARARHLALLRAHGYDATSFQTLGCECRVAFYGDDACVAYADTGGAWVAAGAPIAPRARLAEVSAAFVREARSRGRRAVFFGTDVSFVARAPGLDAIAIGEQPIWDPRAWRETVRHVRSLREQLRRARAKGVCVMRVDAEALAPGAPLRVAADALAARWLRARPMAPMGFLVQVEPFTFAEERRYYAARAGDALVGFLAMAPIYAERGWFFENLLRDPAAPNGTTEALFDAAMRDLGDEGVAYATLGLAPLAGTVAPWLRRARVWGRPLYDFSGLWTFKQKLRPSRAITLFLAYPRGTHPALALYDVLSAFARGRFLRFGLATLFRGPDLVVRALTAALIPWTALLLSVDTAKWFPSLAVQRAWGLFDVALVIALLALAVRWRGGLATALAVAITADAVITLGEAIAFDLGRVHGAADRLALLVAILAPSLAAVVLWNARARHRLAHRAIAPRAVAPARIGVSKRNDVSKRPAHRSRGARL